MKSFTTILFILMLISTGVFAADDSWLLGKWELSYDPDDAPKDWLEFTAEGDVYSEGPMGRVEGMYVITAGGVKAVFTVKDKDIIMNFRYDEQDRALKITTSRTGRASVYRKVVSR